MTRADIYLKVLSEKTGEPPERLVLVLDALKRRLNDDLDDELDPVEAEHLTARLQSLSQHGLDRVAWHAEKTKQRREIST